MHLLSLWLIIVAPDDTQASLERLEQATVSAEPSSTSETELVAAIAAAEQQAVEFGSDPDALETVARARLALAWVHLARNQPDQAEAAMDEAIRSAMGKSIPAGSFGPDVLELHDRRKLALQAGGTASIEVDCDRCQVIINEHRSPNPSEPLVLGEYRVWVTSRDGVLEPARFDVELATAGGVQTRAFGPVETANPEPDGDAAIAVTDTGPNDRKRMLPRWAEILGATAGVGLIVSGVVLNSLHGKCQGDASNGDPTDPVACPNLYENHPQDYVLMGVGGGLVALSGVFLTVDEVRVGRARGRQAMMTWTVRF